MTHRCILSGYNRWLGAAAMGPSVVAEVKALAAFVEERCRSIIVPKTPKPHINEIFIVFISYKYCH